jgi:hypothetical protein
LVSDIQFIPFAPGQHIAGLAAHHRSITEIAKQKPCFGAECIDLYNLAKRGCGGRFGETVPGLSFIAGDDDA